MAYSRMTDGEWAFRELKFLWKERNSYTEDDIDDTLLDVADKIIKRGSNLGREMKEYYENGKIENNKCPKCRSELRIKSIPINTTEAYGSPCVETANILYCDCGWEQDYDE